MKKNKITVDELLNVIPNKYELAIVCGKLVREKMTAGDKKHEVMDDVFKEILENKIEIKEN
ncbi:DNA-directed RNA polymerase subunit omega [Oceanivirga salmonicida]|uniref:DNA-directed RNA polymerase subunit omega n=1 Tax=Oceanivirga salmonicida TaxID=1769291 RepID=UPI0008311865|nr:DNA-directed RNA polymerase subunit omega [Oceanivirga salmonicida]